MYDEKYTLKIIYQRFLNFIINIAPDKRVTERSDVPLTSSITGSGHTAFIWNLSDKNCDIQTNFISRLYFIASNKDVTTPSFHRRLRVTDPLEVGADSGVDPGDPVTAVPGQ